MQLSIRRAIPTDATRLSELAKRAKAHWNYPAEWLAAWQPQLTIEPRYVIDNHVLVAESSDQLLGMCALEDHGSWWSLEHVWVDPRSMGHGVGKALVRQVLELARNVRPGRVVTEADPNAAGFYRRMGATDIGVVPAAMPGAPDRVLPVLEFLV